MNQRIPAASLIYDLLLAACFPCSPFLPLFRPSSIPFCVDCIEKARTFFIAFPSLPRFGIAGGGRFVTNPPCHRFDLIKWARGRPWKTRTKCKYTPLLRCNARCSYTLRELHFHRNSHVNVSKNEGTIYSPWKGNSVRCNRGTCLGTDDDSRNAPTIDKSQLLSLHVRMSFKLRVPVEL